uniref:ATP synthase F0 subunit 8 n=1 Tax=Ergaula capucina TaxID=76901 RepID=A0A2P1H8I7_ERGCA|nr:ATP synthase F0 subunit 8 [Ergaula capucina]WGO58227.1 ATP synthase F0 subunit 8 [Ergaula capucina]
MPQMMPMNWTLLYSLFILIFLLFNFMNYYSLYLINNNKSLKMMKIPNMTWKW